ncbi:MAG: DivIVA domain-containing protein [Desulfovibrio sp.]
MSLSKIDLLNKQFTSKVYGYSREEVDLFLQEIADVLGRYAEDRKKLVRKVKLMEKQLEEARQRDEVMRETLLSTQKMIEEIKSGASKEAEQILAEANNKAEQAVQQGHSRLAQLHEEVEGLKRQRTVFQSQLRGLLETHMRLLDSETPESAKLEELESKLRYLRKVE